METNWEKNEIGSDETNWKSNWNWRRIGIGNELEFKNELEVTKKVFVTI